MLACPVSKNCPEKNLRYVVQSTKELEFFGGVWFDDGAQNKARDYEEDWSNVWARR